MYRLEFSSASGQTRSFDEQRVLRIGRSRDSDIVLDSPSISRRHGELRPTATGWDLVDIGSTGGTWVDNQRISHVSLGATTTVRFGAVSDGVAAFITIAYLTPQPTDRPITSTRSCSPISSAPTSTATVNPRWIVPSMGC